MTTSGVNLTGQVAIVTGAASGIGRAGALSFAAAGARVMVADLNETGARETVEMISAAGGESAAIGCNVTVEDQVAHMVAETVRRFGQLDCAFNNAGNALGQAKIHEIDLADWEASIAVNLTSVFLCMKHEIGHMIANGGGTIVNTSSGAARVPAPGRAPYSAAKRGVVGLTVQAARTYVRQGVRVNAVLPGVILTPALEGNHDEEGLARMAKMMPTGRLGEPAEIGDVAAWLCSDGARFVNGQAIPVDGGAILA